MPDHEFEKRIQEKMGELKLRPTAPVWERVEQGLNKKDKRRRGLLWLPLFVAALTGIYFLADHINFNNQVVSNKETPITPGVSKIEQENITEKINQTNIRRQDDVNRSSIKPNDALKTAVNGVMVKTTIARRKTSTSLQNTIGRQKNKNNPAQTTKQGNVISRSVTNPRMTNESGKMTEVPFKEMDKIKVDHGMINNQASDVADEHLTRELLPSVIRQVQKPVWEIDIFRSTSLPVIKPAEKRAAAVKKRRSAIGFAFSGGRAHINNGKFTNLFENESLSSRIVTAASPNANPSPSGIIYIPPSELKPGFAFSAGGYIKRQVTKAIKVSVGLNYKFYSSSNKIGSGKDSIFPTIQLNGAMADMRTTVYRTGTTNSYINRFHFIEIPVFAEGRLVNGTLPVFWNAGLSYSRMLSTNALHYNSNYRLYYKDNNLFIRNQVNVNTGVNAMLFSKASNPLHLGPELSYGLTDLLKGRDNDSRHFFYIGLKASMTINN